MPEYIIRVRHPDTKEFLYGEWSTVVDAPVTALMPLDEFKKYYRENYGENGMKEFPDRLKRAQRFGTSSHTPLSLGELISCNRAGENETHLTIAEIARQYVAA